MPAAVLLVDLGTRHVTFANDQARRLAPGLVLPAPLLEWAERAGFDGESSPFARIVSGEEATELLPTPEGVGTRLAWMTGFPLDEAAGLGATALLVLRDLGDGAPAEVESASGVRDRAVVAMDVSFTITDPALPDNPLVFVNPAFTRTTGYGFNEAVGRNCRFLQGPETDPADVNRIREALRDRRSITVTLLNYRADRTPFWNELSLSPVFDGHSALTHYVGVQVDVTARIAAERQREAAFAAEREARAEAERARAAAEVAQARLSLLAEATSLLTATLNVDEAMDRLARLAVPLLADWCAVDLVEDGGPAHRVALAHVDPAGVALIRRADELRPRHLAPGSMTARVLADGEPLMARELTDNHFVGIAYDEEQLDLYRQLECRSAMVLPLRARRQNLGTMTLVTTSLSDRQFAPSDLELAKDLARRAALAVDNARLYTREHEVAEALQRSLLPVLPDLPGLSLAARYLASSVGAQIGGDWYDVLDLPDGAVGLAIGDVMGHDLSAAAAMGQFRSVLRSYAWEGDPTSAVLDRLDQLVQGLEMAQLATAVYARLEPAEGYPATLRYANAGHLPPVLRAPTGAARFLDGGQSVLLGASVEGQRAEASELVVPGTTLVLYTDGLIERRGEAIDQSLAMLLDAVEACSPDADPETLCDELLEGIDSETLSDDIALLVVRADS